MPALLEKNLNQRKDRGELRTLPLYGSAVDFASHDYLGFARSEELLQQIVTRWQEIKKVGSSGSRLFTGTSEYVLSLEEKLARIHNQEGALIFQSGFAANLGLLCALGKEGTVVLFDSKIHASTRLGIKLGKGESYPFKHNDLNHLESRLKKTNKLAFVCVESIYSTNGAFAPLKELVFLCDRYSAHLIVDEAHSTGLFGKNGEGLVSNAHLDGSVFAKVHTFSKALGVQGAAVVGSSLLQKTLINFAPSFIYTTALPYYALVAIECAYEKMLTASHLREALFALCPKNSPIETLLVDNPKEVVGKVKHLGFAVAPLRSPTVCSHEQGIRISYHAFNTLDQKKELMSCVKSL